MANLFKENAVDDKKVKEGIWFDYDETCKFKLSMASSDEYKDALIDKQNQLAKRFRKGKIKTASQQHALAEVLTETIIKGWEGVEWGPKDKPLEFTKENCMMILKDKQAGLYIMEWILQNAGEKDEFLAFNIEDDSKN